MKFNNKIRMTVTISSSSNFFIKNYVLLIGKEENSETK